jgi:hypothetical protein
MLKFAGQRYNKKRYGTNNTKASRKVLAKIPYVGKPLRQGYSDQSLYVNVTTLTTEVRPVDPGVKELFVGG